MVETPPRPDFKQLVTALNACEREGWTPREVLEALARPWPHRFVFDLDRCLLDVRGVRRVRVEALEWFYAQLSTEEVRRVMEAPLGTVEASWLHLSILATQKGLARG